jgi:hypothetical protein
LCYKKINEPFFWNLNFFRNIKRNTFLGLCSSIFFLHRFNNIIIYSFMLMFLTLKSWISVNRHETERRTTQYTQNARQEIKLMARLQSCDIIDSRPIKCRSCTNVRWNSIRFSYLKDQNDDTIICCLDMSRYRLSISIIKHHKQKGRRNLLLE